jgi:methylenetetrahydrofolate--tRNA-(uracil-5-)-methyltransferase
MTLHVVGGGLAGSEAAWQAANMGIKVILHEMRTENNLTPAHKTDKCAELVCSNSFRNDDINSAIGLLHQEMRECNSLIIQSADASKVPAGSALAMDRDKFSELVHQNLLDHPNIHLVKEEVNNLPDNEDDIYIFATGPLTSDKLSEQILSVTGEDHLAFFDAIAPIVYKDSIDWSQAWMQSRYDKAGSGGGDGKDYINCPLNQEQYYNFIDELLAAEHISFKDWEQETPYFNGCLPIEVMAARGKETLRHGPMKPVGLIDPNTGEEPYAVVQLRQDNLQGSLYNMVGFQTKLRYGEQTRVFRQIPGLEEAEFTRLGGLHRNTFINSPKLLDDKLRLSSRPKAKFAGQITGVEGYVESAAMGLLAGRFSALEEEGYEPSKPPRATALGSLLAHITEEANSEDFQPMNVNFGLFPRPGKKLKKKERGPYYSNRALELVKDWQAEYTRGNEGYNTAKTA